MSIGNSLAPNKGCLQIRAYCAKCHSLLQESVIMSKKQLIASWDRAVLGAVNIQCKSCGTKFPNFNIDLKVYNARLHSEYDPSKYIKLPKRKQTPTQLLTSISKKWLSEHPGIEDSSIDEARDIVEFQQSNDGTKSPEQVLAAEIAKRTKYYSVGNKDIDGQDITDR